MNKYEVTVDSTAPGATPVVETVYANDESSAVEWLRINRGFSSDEFASKVELVRTLNTKNS